MAVQDFQLLNRTVLADDGVQAHGAGDAGLARERRIDRLNAVDNASGLDVTTDAEWTTLMRFRRGWRTAHATDNAAKHTAHGTTGNATWDTAGHTDRGHVRLGVFLNNFYFPGDDLRRHKFAGVHQVGLRLDVNDLRNGRRRRRGGRRRRCGEHRRHHGLG